jgi:hypothetical protein
VRRATPLDRFGTLDLSRPATSLSAPVSTREPLPETAGDRPVVRGPFRVLEPLHWTPRSAGLALGLVAVATVVPILRQTGASALETIWAEDGRQFLQTAVAEGPIDALLTPYGGYLHTVPRLVAELASLLPLGFASELFTLSANLIAALCAFTVFVASAGHLRTVWLRGVLAALMVLAPTSAFEVTNNAANAQWFLLIAAFWVLLGFPRSRVGTLLAAVLLVATALSAPLSLLLVPLALWRLVRRSSPAGERMALVIFVLAVGAQLGIALASPFASDLVAGSPAAIVFAFVQRVLGTAVFGQRLAGLLWAHFGWDWPFIATCGLMVLLAIGLIAGPERTRWLSVLAAGYAVAFFVAAVLLRHGNLMWPPGSYNAIGGRYTVVPIMHVFAMAAAVLDSQPPRVDPRLWRVLHVCALVAVAVIAVTNFRTSNDRTHGPIWSESVTAARQRCAAPGQQLATLDISPRPWTVEVRCDELDPRLPDG